MNSLTQTLPSEATLHSFAPAPAAPAKAKAKARRLPWSKIVAGAAATAVAAAGIASTIYYTAGFESTDDAYLEGHVHPVSPRINGTVSRVLVDDNAHVKEGQPLVEIDPADLALAAQGAEANVAQSQASAEAVKAQTYRAESDVAAASARIDQNAAELNRAQLDFNRMQALVKDDIRAVSTQEVDAARAALDSAVAARQSLIAQRSSAEATLAAVKAQEAVAAAQVRKTEADLASARLQVNYTVILSPVTGRVAKKSVEVGQRLQPGQPMMAVVDDDVWVVANFKEGQLAHLRPGEKVSVLVDAVDGRSFTGTVESFSPGTGAKFALLAPDNATGNFTKVVQRVPVKIVFTPDSLGAESDRLYPGLSAVVKVAVR